MPAPVLASYINQRPTEVPCKHLIPTRNQHHSRLKPTQTNSKPTAILMLFWTFLVGFSWNQIETNPNQRSAFQHESPRKGDEVFCNVVDRR